MKLCPSCAYHNREGFLYCEECGYRLMGIVSTELPTREIEFEDMIPSIGPTWGTARFDAGAEIIFRIHDSNTPISLKPDGETLIGRFDGTNVIRPDLDLTPFGALEKGVSRVHAAINRTENTLTIIDKGSSNGTHLNGQRLLPGQPRVLRDGDEVRLGKLIAHIFFKK